MHVIKAKSVSDAYHQGMTYLASHGERDDSRAGGVVVSPVPVTTVYMSPKKRVLFNEERRCNHFFHLFEALWMLAGRNDVEFIQKFNKRMFNYSDDETTFHGAYGYRWRKHFGFDQVTELVDALRKNPKERRAVIGMWDPQTDLNKEGLDFPCNTQICFRLRGALLDMTVFNRSNDMIWGAYGVNAVHMSILQEYVAYALNVEVGTYYQVSNNYHAYTEVFDKLYGEAGPVVDKMDVEYTNMMVTPLLIDYENIEMFDKDLDLFMEWIDNDCRTKAGLLSKPKQCVPEFQTEFFTCTAGPMATAWFTWKETKDIEETMKILRLMNDGDWKIAAMHWMRVANQLRGEKQ